MQTLTPQDCLACFFLRAFTGAELWAQVLLSLYDRGHQRHYRAFLAGRDLRAWLEHLQERGALTPERGEAIAAGHWQHAHHCGLHEQESAHQ